MKRFGYLFLTILILLVPSNAKAEVHEHEDFSVPLITLLEDSGNLDFSGGLLDGKLFAWKSSTDGRLEYTHVITDNDLTTYYSFYSGTLIYTFQYPANITGYRIYTNCSSCTSIRFVLADGTIVRQRNPNVKGDFIELNLENVTGIEIYRTQGLSLSVYEFNVYGTISMPLPSKVEGVTVANISHNAVTISWNPVEDAIKYKIYLDNRLVGETADNSYNLTNLKANTSYTVRVSAVNEGGEGPSSDPISFTTLPLPVPSRVQGVKVRDITATSALISWDANPEREGVLKYVVYLNNEKHGETTNTEYTLDNLQPSTTYTVRIEAINVYGAGPQSDPVEFTTLETLPDPATQVRNIVVKNMTSTSALISWTPNPASERIIKYVIYVNGEKHGETESTEYILENLKEGEKYIVTVTAVNILGEGPPSAPMRFTPYKIADISSTIKVQDVWSAIAVLFTNLWPLIAFILAVIAIVPITTALKQAITRRT